MEENKDKDSEAAVSKQKLASSMFVYIIGGILPQAINFLLLPVFSRLLTPKDFGILGYVASVTAFLTITNTLSMNSFYLRSYFQEADKKKFTGSIFYFLLLINIVFILAEAFVLKYVFAALKIQVPFVPFMQLGLTECFFSAISIIPLRYYRLEFNARRYFLFSIGQVVLAQVLGLYFICFLHWGAAGKLLGTASAAMIAAFFYLLDVRCYAHLGIDYEVIQKGIRFSMPLLLGAYAGMLVSISDRFILERFVPLEQLGIYSVSCSITSLLSVLITAVIFVLEPLVYRISDSNNFLSEYLRYKDYAYFIVFLAVGLLVIFSQDIIYLFLSAKFRAAAGVLPVIALSYVFAVARDNSALLLMVKNKTFNISLITIVAAVASVALNIIFIPHFGIMAAAVVAVLSALIAAMLNQVLIKRSMKINLGIKRDVTAVAVLVLLMLIIRMTNTYALPLKLAMDSLLVIAWSLFAFRYFKISWQALLNFLPLPLRKMVGR